MSTDNSIYNIQQTKARLDKLQELTSTGQIVNRPSDDPLSSRLLLDIGDKIRGGDQYVSNINKSKTWQQLTDTALTGMTDTMGLAKSLVATLLGGTTDPIIRQDAVAKLQGLKQQMVDMGNTQLGDQYLFGGANNNTPPFNYNDNTYAGDDTQISIEIGKNSTQSLNITGDRLLQGTGTNPNYGSVDILKTFDDLIAAVGGDGITGSPNENGDLAGIQAGSTALNEGTKQIYNAQSDVAARTSRLDSMSKLNANTRSTMELIYSNTQNVDYAKLAAELSQQQIAYQASLSTTAKLSSLSMLDYLK